MWPLIIIQCNVNACIRDTERERERMRTFAKYPESVFIIFTLQFDLFFSFVEHVTQLKIMCI